jgi:hypothetical protein
MAWSTPTQITSATKISDTDNIIEANAQNLEAYVNGTAPYTEFNGLTSNMVDKSTPQTITAQKTFSTAIIASGGVTGDVTGNVTGNVTGDLTGDITGDAKTLNGEVVADTVVSTSATAPAAQNSVKTAYDSAVAAQATADSKVAPTDYATSTVGGTVKVNVVGSTLYITTT